MKTIVLSLIEIYRKFISPFRVPACRFVPTCSSYAREAVSQHGVIRGVGFALARLMRCHPLCPGGYDPVLIRQVTGGDKR